MKLSTCLPFALLLSVGSAPAQQLAPAPVDLTYRFHPGQKLHYQKRLELRNPDNIPGRWAASDEVTETFITVESVNADGSATLIVRNYEPPAGQTKEDAKEEGSLVTVVRGQDIPIYSITVDSYGRFLSGTIIKRNLDDSQFVEKMKDPKFVGHRLPDTSLIKLWAKDLLPTRPRMKSSLPGARYHDSVYKAGKVEHFPLGGPTASGAPKVEPPPQPTYDLDLDDYSIVLGPEEKQQSEFRLIDNNGHDQVWNGKLMSHGVHSSDTHIRTADGLITKRTEIGRRVNDGKPESAYMKRTLTLISVQ